MLISSLLAQRRRQSGNCRNSFDIVYHGSVNNLTNDSETLNRLAILRQREAWATPDGKWARVYVTYSRKVYVVESADNFASWEAQQLIPSPP